jgi:hypothetical protein
MDEHDNATESTSGEYRVGYKRPPLETRFKKGQKRPRRKEKVVQNFSPKDLFWSVLQERRRVIINGKATWPTNAELIARRALLEAEKGSPVLMRLSNELLLGAGRAGRGGAAGDHSGQSVELSWAASLSGQSELLGGQEWRRSRQLLLALSSLLMALSGVGGGVANIAFEPIAHIRGLGPLSPVLPAPRQVQSGLTDEIDGG